MSEFIIVFKEQKYHFGLYPSDFEYCIPLDQIWISPLGNQTTEWKFENKDNGLKGTLINLGSHLQLSVISFSHKGNVFIKKMEDGGFLGIFSENAVYQTKIKEADEKNLIEAKKIEKYPPNIPQESYKGFYKYKRKIVYIIDPAKLFESSRMS